MSVASEQEHQSISLQRLGVRRFTCKGSTGSVALRSFGAVRTSVLLSVRGSTGARFVHRSSLSRLLFTRELLDSPDKAAFHTPTGGSI